MMWAWCRDANVVLDPLAFLLACLYFSHVQLRALYLVLVLGFVLGHVNGTLNAVLWSHSSATWVTGWYTLADLTLIGITIFYAIRDRDLPLGRAVRRIVTLRDNRAHPRRSTAP